MKRSASTVTIDDSEFDFAHECPEFDFALAAAAEEEEEAQAQHDPDTDDDVFDDDPRRRVRFVKSHMAPACGPSTPEELAPPMTTSSSGAKPNRPSRPDDGE